MRDDRQLPALAVVILPVALGFGLIYLFATGSLDGQSILLAVVGIVLLVPLVGILVDLREGGRARHQEETRLRLRRTYGGRR